MLKQFPSSIAMFTQNHTRLLSPAKASQKQWMELRAKMERAPGAQNTHQSCSKPLNNSEMATDFVCTIYYNMHQYEK